MNAIVHVIMRTWQYSELQDPFGHAGGNEVLKHGQAKHEDEKTRNRKNRIRQLIVQVSVRKYWGYLTENLARGTTRPTLDSRSLGRCPWPDLGRLLSVSAGDYETRVGTSKQKP